MDPDVAWAVWSHERAQRVESVIATLLAKQTTAAARLYDAMTYAVLGGGKRMRALLAYAAGEVGDAPADAVDAVAGAVELIHAYSLVHDDLPCMDDDDMRRGKPSCHIAHGEAMAVLAGDALQTLAFAALASAPRTRRDTFGRLAMASGAAGMAAGQAIDLDSVGRSLPLAELERMHALKTGALIVASVRMGAECGRALDPAEADALDRYGAAIGLAFQVVDDVLDVEGDPAVLGKTVGKDVAQNRATFVTLMGIGAAKARVVELAAEAHAALAGFGASARRLGELADWIVTRQH